MNLYNSLLTCIVVFANACSREASAPPASRVQALTSANSAPDALDRMDARAALPMLPHMALHQKQNMRDHLVAVQEIVAALASQDFAGVERAADRIGSSEQMIQMCSHMGAGAAGFTEQALAFHQTADRIASAAREHDTGRVLSEFAATLQTCTSCHAAWKQQVVDEPTWQRLTALAPVHRGE